MTLRGLTLLPEAQEYISRMQQQAISPLCVAKDGLVIGLLSISDPEARDVVQALRDRGIKHIVILTGDHKDVARRIAAELGITEYLAEVFPGDKPEAVQRLQREGYKVAVVGDGAMTLPCWPMLTWALPSKGARKRPEKRRLWCSYMEGSGRFPSRSISAAKRSR